jgi:phosphoglycolate phosphatase-like HAD superfamily hydrolase
MVGDSWKDAEVARAAGCRMIFVGGAHADAGTRQPERVAASLAEAAKMILRDMRKKKVASG